MSRTIKQEPSSSSSSSLPSAPQQPTAALAAADASPSPPSSPITIASRSPSPPAWFDPATNKIKTKKTVSFTEEDDVRIITPRPPKTKAKKTASSSSSNDLQEIPKEEFVPRRSVRAAVVSKRKAEAEADADAAVAVKRVKKEKKEKTTTAAVKKGKGKEVDAAEAPSGPGKLDKSKGKAVEVAAPVGPNATSAVEPDARVTRSLSRKRSAAVEDDGAAGAAKKQKVGESSGSGLGGSSSGAGKHIPRAFPKVSENAALQPGENGVYYLSLGKDMSSDWLVKRGIAHTAVTLAKIAKHKFVVSAVNNNSITTKLIPSSDPSASAFGIIYIVPASALPSLSLRLHTTFSPLPALVLSPSSPDAAPGDWHKALAETGETLSVLVALGEAAEEETEEAALAWLARPENSKECGQLNQGILEAIMGWSLPSDEIRKWVPLPPNPYAGGEEEEEAGRTRSGRVGGARGGAKGGRRRGGRR